MASEKKIKISYTGSLSGEGKARYLEKIKLIDNRDPYAIENNQWSKELKNEPNVEHGDIAIFLLVTTSFHTNEEIKAYKSLESYNQFLNGWVTDVKVCRFNENYVYTSQVGYK